MVVFAWQVTGLSASLLTSLSRMDQLPVNQAEETDVPLSR
jgi:hypothetical protein